MSDNIDGNVTNSATELMDDSEYVSTQVDDLYIFTASDAQMSDRIAAVSPIQPQVAWS